MTNKERSNRRTFQLGVITVIVVVVVVGVVVVGAVVVGVVVVVVVVVVNAGLSIVKGLAEINVAFNPLELIASILRM